MGLHEVLEAWCLAGKRGVLDNRFGAALFMFGRWGPSYTSRSTPLYDTERVGPTALVTELPRTRFVSRKRDQERYHRDDNPNEPWIPHDGSGTTNEIGRASCRERVYCEV